MGRFDGKTVFITGGARGMGRSHATAFAHEGANIVALDIAAQIETVQWPLASPEDLEATAEAVREAGGECLAVQADVRDRPAVDAAVASAISQFGSIDVLLANHGLAVYGTLAELDHAAWDDQVDTMLTGTWNVLKAVVPHMIERESGRIIVTASGTVRWPQPQMIPYLAAKFGLVGIVKGLSQELIKQGITVNAVNPGLTGTPIILNDANYQMFSPDNPTREGAEEVWTQLGSNGEPYMQAEDITDGVLFLASPQAKKISGLLLDISGGMNAYQMG